MDFTSVAIRLVKMSAPNMESDGTDTVDFVVIKGALEEAYLSGQNISNRRRDLDWLYAIFSVVDDLVVIENILKIFNHNRSDKVDERK